MEELPHTPEVVKDDVPMIERGFCIVQHVHTPTDNESSYRASTKL